MKNKKTSVGFILLANGIIDILCAAVLLVLPRMKAPMLGYDVFHFQGAYMAGGWGIATLALGVVRIYTSHRPDYHGTMVLLGAVEGLSLAIFSIITMLLTESTITQVLLSLMVGAVFGVLYLVFLLKGQVAT